MKSKAILSSTLAVGLLSLGILAGSVVRGGSVAAQTPAQATATAVPSTQATPGTTNPSTKDPSMGRGGRHGGPGGPGGFGGHGGGHHGGLGGAGLGPNATADGATRSISNTTSLITLIKADLAYATGKMDTSDAQGWLNGADTLLARAKSANSSAQYGQAVTYAAAASQLTNLAHMQIAQELGASSLPSYSQHPMGRHGGHAGKDGVMSDDPNATINEAQASRILARTYNQLVAVGAVVKSSSSAGDAATYLTEAQNAYRDAYTAYQAGTYSEAAKLAKLSNGLGNVAGTLAGASGAPANVDAPANVPAPNFP